MGNCSGQNCSCNSDAHDNVITQKHNEVHEDHAGNKVNTFRLFGLDCADCAAKLEKKLSVMNGVTSVSINFGAAKMKVTHNITTRDIIRAVADSGYKAIISDGFALTTENVPLLLDKRVINTTIAGIFLAIGFTSHYYNAGGNITIYMFLLAMLTGGYFIVRSALTSLKSRTIDMNVLMSIAALGALGIGEWAEGATAMFLFSLGNSLQAVTMDKTRGSIKKLMDLTPHKATVIKNGLEISIPVEKIQKGEIIVVRPGEKIALDGIISSGYSTVNQAPITGESNPVEKKPGLEVYAGTINQEGALEIRVTKLIKDTTLAKIVEMVEEAQSPKAPSQQFVDRFARYYTPVVIATALAVATIPYLFLGLEFKPWLEKALILLVIACPCALVISTPVAIVSAIGSAARQGVLIKGGAHLENAGALKAIAFDKTGTLTTGKLEVTDIAPLQHSNEEILKIAAAIENRSQHPVAQAIVNKAKSLGLVPLNTTDFVSFTGKGASAIIGDVRYYIGTRKLFFEKNINISSARKIINKLQCDSKTSVLLGTANEVIGVIAMADRVRANSRSTIQRLKKAGIKKTFMLTGDSKATAQTVHQQTGLDAYHSELLPEDKLRIIYETKEHCGKIAMVGDGVNDAPALAAADLGIAMGGAGTDAALETADIVLMADDLTKLPYAVKLGRRTLAIIKQNIAFSLALKAVFIGGTFLGLTNLWMAVFADTGASLIVILNGMRLMLVKNTGATTTAGHQTGRNVLLDKA